MSELVPRGVPESREPRVDGQFVRSDGEEYYRIRSFDRMPPFLVNLPSDTDIWMFLSSNGGVAAGRVSAEGSLFPYETVDRLHLSHAHTGPITLIQRWERNRPTLWEPFSEDSDRKFRIGRRLYKNTTGNRLIFEEVNLDLLLSYRQQWSACDEFGVVRTVSVRNLSALPARLDLLDGLRNILPYGAPLSLYQTSSSLVDAYKRADCDPQTGMGVFSLTSKIVDRPEAAEVLRANVVWCQGLERFTVSLSPEAVSEFRDRNLPRPEGQRTGRAASYLVSSSLELEPQGGARWHVLADVGLDHRKISALRVQILERPAALGFAIERGLADARDSLRRNVASADGLQESQDEEVSVHHYTSVLFNNMRGGVFAKNHDIPVDDFREFLRDWNRRTAERHDPLFASLPTEISVRELTCRSAETTDPNMHRASLEYLPLYFGRRHGDPSRPWNRFELRMKRPDGGRALHFEGNWRDIFQNWEALGVSFPHFLPSFIAKFVNASTVDGFNPYRITRDGFEWEVPDPEDPWSCIGYWGDHQIAYLLRLLESLPRYSPGTLESLLAQEIFAYADVPYRILPYERLVENPSATIEYDRGRAAEVERRRTAIGSDGALLAGADGEVYHVSLLEKLLVPALAKLSNFVPEGGIWMNTQRPEWNDANNALAGSGLSVVTLCYLRRYLWHVGSLLESQGERSAPVSSEVVQWLREIAAILSDSRPLLAQASIDDRERRDLVDALGQAFGRYRAQVYAHGFSGRTELPFQEAARLCRTGLEHLDHAIRSNRREDGLYHSYNLLDLVAGRRASLRRLHEMLEGQVAVLNSGAIDPTEAVSIVADLFASAMYRPNEKSFLLYPERQLPGFLERNTVPEEPALTIPLVGELLEVEDDSILLRDELGVIRFHADITRVVELEGALETLALDRRWTEAVRRDRASVLDLFDTVFGHSSYTGRSGTMYGYEGLGCIYWHMVSKLLLAIQDQALESADRGLPPAVTDQLVDDYYRLRAGLGFEKSPSEYGAFPTDPYSHTPPQGGASQPGMTGQVKEDILARFGELGVRARAGRLSFHPLLLRRSELRTEPGEFAYFDVHGEERSIEVPAGGLAFTVCQVPIVYERGGNAWIRVTLRTGETRLIEGNLMDEDTSQAVFAREGGVSRIDVGVPEDVLR